MVNYISNSKLDEDTSKRIKLKYEMISIMEEVGCKETTIGMCVSILFDTYKCGVDDGIDYCDKERLNEES